MRPHTESYGHRKEKRLYNTLLNQLRQRGRAGQRALAWKQITGNKSDLQWRFLLPATHPFR